MLYNEPQLKSWSTAKPKYDLKSIGETLEYIHDHEMRKNEAKFWGQKTPRFINEIELLNKTFRDIRWILIYRDPRAVVSSMLFSKRHTYSVKRAVKRWKNDNLPIIKFINRINKDVLIMSYEDLVLNFEDNITKVYSFLNIGKPNIESILNYNYNAKRSREYKGFRFERNEIRSGLIPQGENIGNWKLKLKNSQIAYIEQKCHDEMKILGYESIITQYKQSYWFQLSELVNSFLDILIIFEYLKKWPEYLIRSQIRKMIFKLNGVKA